jgi:hypothetical protein
VLLHLSLDSFRKRIRRGRELLRRLMDVLQQSRRTEADLVALIGEGDTRRLYAREASPSMRRR